MFEGVQFTHTEAPQVLTSSQVTIDTLHSEKFDPDNLLNSEFSISGSVDTFTCPPIIDFALKRLFHLQSFGIFHYKKGSFTKRKDYHSFLLLYTYGGSAKLEYCGKKYNLGQYDGAFIDCRKQHIYTATADWDVAVMHFDGPLAPYMYSEMEKTGGTVFHEPDTGHFQQMIEELLGIYSSPSLQRDLRAHHRIEGMLLHLLVISSNINLSRNDVPRSIQTAMKYMEDNFTRDISLDDLASIVSTSKYHFAKEFKKYIGFTPHDYLISLRINRAKALLKTTDMPVNKIAAIVGVSDINNFNYLFKKRLGMTPLQYRSSSDFIV